MTGSCSSPVADDQAITMSGAYVTIPVLQNDPAKGSRILNISSCTKGGLASLIPVGSTGNSGNADVIRYVSKAGKHFIARKNAQEHRLHCVALSLLGCIPSKWSAYCINMSSYDIPHHTSYI
jgi:hypothetical protein